MVGPLGPCRLGHRCRQPEGREQIADRERDDHRRRDAAPLAPTHTAQPDLHRPRREAEAAQHPIRGVLSADRRAGGLERLAKVDSRPAANRRERGEGRREDADRETDEQHRRVDAEADVDGPERLAEVAGEQVREDDPEHGSGDRAENAEKGRRLRVDESDLAAARAERPHHPDLAGLLGDERRHRVRDEDERREQRQHGDHAQELRELGGLGLPRPVAGRPNLRQAREAREPGRRAEVAPHRLDRLRGRGGARVAEQQGEPVVTRPAVELCDGVRGRVEDDHVVVLDVLAAGRVAGLDR